VIVPPYEAKCYGAVHIDNYLSFIGFCKKVYSDEVCKVDVFLDDEKIDTILCDKTVDKIEQIYEIGSHCFKYELDDKYFDKRHMLSFKCDGEELLHSPIETISKDDEKYNEYKFLHSLENTNYDELKDMYKPNSIGFLATRENLEDEEFVGYIKYISDNFRDSAINCFYYSGSPKSNKILKNIKNIEYINISSIKDMVENMEIYIQNSNIQNNKLREILLTNFDNIFCIVYNKDIFELTLKEHSNMSMKKGFPYFDNPTYFGFTDKEITKSNGNMHSLINFNFFGIDFDIDINQSTKDYLNFNIYNVINNKEYKRYRNNLFLKFKQYCKEKNEY
jgi:hypothetical protein